jgi:hypothetical protein
MAALAPVAVLYIAYIAIYAFLRAQIGNLTLMGWWSMLFDGGAPYACATSYDFYVSNIVAILGRFARGIAEDALFKAVRVGGRRLCVCNVEAARPFAAGVR